MYVAQYKISPEVAKVLLDAGADVDKALSNGETALKIAIEVRSECLTALLLAYGGLLSIRDFDKPSFSRLKLIRNLIAYNPEVNNDGYARIFREHNPHDLYKCQHFSSFSIVSKACRKSHIFSSSVMVKDSKSRVGLSEDIALMICSFLITPPSSPSYLMLYRNLKDRNLVQGFINSYSAKNVFPFLEYLRLDQEQGVVLPKIGSALMSAKDLGEQVAKKPKIGW